MQEGELEQGQFNQQNQNSQQQSGEFITTKRAGRKKLCDVCTGSLAKYTCPGCLVKSCSLVCINKHKTQKECDGKIKHNNYVEKCKIGEEVVRKDFQFVKSMLGEADKVKKTLAGVTAVVQEPKRFSFLRKQARVQYNIRVHQAPPMIQRHRQNISFFYMKTKQIYWVVEILYYKGNKKYTQHLLEPKADSKTILEILPTDFLCKELLLKEVNTQKPQQFDVFIENRQINQSNTQNQNQKKIIQVNKNQKLCQSLRNLNVYEFPTLILVHPNFRKSFMKWKKMI